VHTAYYLIHNMSSGRGYTERELEGARNFAFAAERAGLEHIIYLGGLADAEQHIAPHMRARIETGSTLRQGKTPVTEFRAGVIIGSGSISFEMIRFMTEFFPVFTPGSSWFHNLSQPIAVQNVVDYLKAALKNPAGHGRILEIGGPETIEYKDLILRYARLRGLRRVMALVPYIPVWFMAFGVHLMTPVRYPIAYALVEGLAHDSIVRDDQTRRFFPEVELLGTDEAIKKALGYLSPLHIERVWDDGARPVKSLKHEGCFIHHREIKVNASRGEVFQTLLRITGNSAWQVEADEADARIVVRVKRQTAGDKWFEWRVSEDSNLTSLTQTVFFAPRGIGGFIHWYLLYPIHIWLFRRIIRGIARECASL
jgi:uncharacterized protein YbjT (DUF2867 family)